MLRVISTAAVLALGLTLGRSVQAQEIQHPEFEQVFNDIGEQVVVVAGTNQPPNPSLYNVREEEGARGPILAVYYIPDESLVVFFNITRLKGKAQAPGVQFFPQRVSPAIEKVISERSFDKEIKNRFVDELLFAKDDFILSDDIDNDDIQAALNRPRN